MRRYQVGVAIVVIIVLLGTPAFAAHSDYGYDSWDAIEGYSEFADGSDEDIYHWGYTSAGYACTEIGVRISAYKGGYLDGHTKQRSTGGDLITSGPTPSHWINTYNREGDWIGYGYHWAWIGVSTACNTVIDWEVGSKALACWPQANARLDHMLAFDTKAVGFDDWQLVAFEDYDGIKKALGEESGGTLAHYLYLNDVEVFGLALQDREPALFISPDRDEVAVVMFHTLANRDVVFRVQYSEKSGGWEVVTQVTYAHAVK